MDYFDLFERTSINGQPIGLILPWDGSGDVIDRACDLLTSLVHRGEIILLVERFPADPPPPRVGNVRVRLVTGHAPTSGAALSRAFRESRCPVLVTLGTERLPKPADVSRLLAALNKADVVVGRRREVGRWPALRRPIEACLRRVFGIPIADPACPLKAIRRRAVAGMHLQSTAGLLPFELMAKTGYLVRLVDEVMLEADSLGAYSGAAGLTFPAILRLLGRPEFGPLIVPGLWFQPATVAPRRQAISVHRHRPGSDFSAILAPRSLRRPRSLRG